MLIVAGDVVPDEVLSLAKSTYGKIPANPNLSDRKRPIEPPHFAPRRIEYVDERVSQPYVVRSYLAPERNSGDQRPAAALALLADILGDGQASVLQRNCNSKPKRRFMQVHHIQEYLWIRQALLSTSYLC